MEATQGNASRELWMDCKTCCRGMKKLRNVIRGSCGDTGTGTSGGAQ